MNRTNELRDTVRRVLTDVASMMPSENDVRTELVCNDTEGHYQLGQVGWEAGRRVDDIFLHVDVLDGKIWIQHDGTDLPLARMLEEAGIRKDEIVLAFHRPDLRKY